MITLFYSSIINLFSQIVSFGKHIFLCLVLAMSFITFSAWAGIPAEPSNASGLRNDASDTPYFSMFGGDVNPDNAQGTQAGGGRFENPIIAWTHQFGAFGAAVDTAQAVTVDGSGNAYIVGRVPGALPSQVNAGSRDVFLRKYDAAGLLVWTQQFGSSGDDTAFAVSVKGNAVYVGGSVGAALPGKIFLGGVSDAFLRKYDTNGNLLWTDQLGTNNTDEIRMIAVDASVSPVAVYVIGQTLGTLPGQTSAGLADVFVRKYEDNGNSFTVVKTIQYGSKTATGGPINAVDTGTVISVDTSLSPTAIYVGGLTNADIDGAGPQIFQGAADGFIQRLDPNLNIIWTRQFGASAGDFVDAGVAAPSGAGVYLVGRTNSSLASPIIGSFDAYAVKYDSNGNQLWIRQFGTIAFDQALSVDVDASRVYIAGFTGGSFAGSSFGGNDGFIRVFDTSGNTILDSQAGSPGSDQFLGIALNGSTLYVAAFSEGQLSGTGTDNTENVGNGDAVLRKYDTSLNDIWTNRFGTIGVNDAANAIVRAPYGEIYVAGSTRGPLGVPISLNDAYIRKYDSAGNEIWTRQFGTNLNDSGLAIAASANGLVCIAGSTEAAIANLPSAGGLDGYVRCYDKNGNELWTRQIGTNLQDDASAIAIDLQGNVIVGGRADGALPNQGPPGSQNAYVKKFDKDGNELWARQYVGGGADGVTTVFGINVDVYGNVLVGGRTFRTLTGEPILGTFDAYVRKYDANGNLSWTRQISSAANDSAIAFSTSPNGDVYVAGFVNATLSTTLPYVALADAFIRKYDADGNVLWTDQFGTSGNDQVSAIYVNAMGQAYVAGFVGAALPGQTSAGGTDGYIKKYSVDGQPLFTLQLGQGIGSPLTDSITGISGHESGDVYVSGTTAGALAGQTTALDNDAFVMKIVRDK